MTSTEINRVPHLLGGFINLTILVLALENILHDVKWPKKKRNHDCHETNKPIGRPIEPCAKKNTCKLQSYRFGTKQTDSHGRL